MTKPTPLFPRQPVPELAVQALGGEPWTLADQRPAHFTMIVFYRGYHCPQCAKQLADLDKKLGLFADRGVEAIAISTDGHERAEKTKTEWKLGALTIGYGLSLDTAREWSLFISSSRGKTSVGIEEPALFTEPGLFLVRPDGTLYWSAVQTMPFARPHFAEVLSALDMVIEKNYPARGEVIDHHAAA